MLEDQECWSISRTTCDRLNGQQLTGGLELMLLLPAAVGPYDVTLVSPRNYFLYTPLLPSAATGTVEPRSIVDPIRSHIPDTVCPFPLSCCCSHVGPLLAHPAQA